MCGPLGEEKYRGKHTSHHLNQFHEKESLQTKSVQTTFVLPCLSQLEGTNNQTAAEGDRIQFPDGPFLKANFACVPSENTRLW